MLASNYQVVHYLGVPCMYGPIIRNQIMHDQILHSLIFRDHFRVANYQAVHDRYGLIIRVHVHELSGRTLSGCVLSGCALSWLCIIASLIDSELLEEIKNISRVIPVYFGKSLRDIKCIITDDEGLRSHTIYINYKDTKKLIITSMDLPYTPLQEREYNSIEEVVNTLRNHINKLKDYFSELESIGRYCTIMEPINPSFKEEYRRILLDNRTWLHVEVTPEGLATNIYLVGQSEHWQDKLQVGLLNWDHDKDIVENIMTIFDITDFPVPENKLSSINTMLPERPVEVTVCSICLCEELPDVPGLPQPLCQSSSCGVYFHRNCLFQWLVACAGGRPPAFGVATGSCPTCLGPIACNEKDN